MIQTSEVSLPYRRAGSGATLVLIHGYLGGSRQWLAEMERWRHQFDVIAFDLAGYGEARHLQAPLEIAQHARNVLHSLDQLGVRDFHLLGHSMGGMIVQEIIHLAPQRVNRLVLYGTGPQGSIPGRFETMGRSRERLAADGVEKTAKRICATWLLDRDASPSLEVLVSLGSCVSHQAAEAGLWAMEAWDGRPYLAAIQSRTLIIWGEHDRSYGWSQIEALWRGIAGASLSVIPASSHAMHLERPALFQSVVLEFLVSPTTGVHP